MSGVTDADVTRARVAGVVAAGVALAVTELVAGLSSEVPSLVVAVGDVFVDGAPGGFVESVIRAIGTADKPALIVGILLVSLLVGAKLGTASLRRPWVGPVGFAVFGLIGWWAGARSPLMSGAGAFVAAALGAVAGVATLRGLLRVGTGERSPVPATTDAGRRQFLYLAGAVGAVAVAMAAGGRWLGRRFNVEAARAEVTLPGVAGGGGVAPGETRVPGEPDVEGLSSFVTPNDDFYRIDTALVIPQVDPDAWRLRVTGMVDEPFELTYEELLDLPLEEHAVTMACVSNEVGGDLVGNARWRGVPRAALLERAGVQDGATQIMGHSVDGFTAGFPTEVLDDGRPAMVVVGMNGEVLPIPHGFPARLVIPGLYGYVSATKWLDEIRLTTLEAEDGYWIPRGWSKEGPIKTQARIDVPRSGSQVPAGRTAVAGVAWAPTRGIERVEVQVDGGGWQEARLGPGNSDDTWRQWVLEWDGEPGSHELTVRATDGTGATQTADSAPPAPDGATGRHSVTVTVE